MNDNFNSWINDIKNYCMIQSVEGSSLNGIWKTEWKTGDRFFNPATKNPFDTILYHVWIKGMLVKSTSDYSLAYRIWNNRHNLHGCMSGIETVEKCDAS